MESTFHEPAQRVQKMWTCWIRGVNQELLGSIEHTHRGEQANTASTPVGANTALAFQVHVQCV